MWNSRPVRNHTIWTDSSTVGKYKKYVWKLRKFPTGEDESQNTFQNLPRPLQLLRRELDKPVVISIFNQKKPSGKQSLRRLHVYPPQGLVLNFLNDFNTKF